MKKKIIALSIAFVLVVGAAIGTTLAYLTDKGGVINNFAVGDVAFEAVEYVDHDNAVGVDKDGGNVTYTTAKGDALTDAAKVNLADTAVTNDFTGVLPGDTFVKDVVITPDVNSSDAYYAVYVTVKNGVAVEAIAGALNGSWTATAEGGLGLAKDYTATANKLDEATLIAVEKGTIDAANDAADTDTGYIFYYFVPAGSSDSITVDLGVTCPSTITKANISAFSGMQIAATVAAIQADGFATADAAITELENTYNGLALTFAPANDGE